MARISSASTSARARARARASSSASTRHRAMPYHRISQSFDLPSATISFSHLTCPLPPHHQSELALALVLEIELALALDIEYYRITASVIWIAPCHHISQSFDLPTATTSSVRASASARHRALPYYHISHSFDLPPATTSVSHLTCPLPPHHQ